MYGMSLRATEAVFITSLALLDFLGSRVFIVKFAIIRRPKTRKAAALPS